MQHIMVKFTSQKDLPLYMDISANILVNKEKGHQNCEYSRIRGHQNKHFLVLASCEEWKEERGKGGLFLLL